METDVLMRFVRKGVRHGATTRRSGVTVPKAEALVKVLRKHPDPRLDNDRLIVVVEVITGQLKVGDQIWVQANELEPYSPQGSS